MFVCMVKNFVIVSSSDTITKTDERPECTDTHSYHINNRYKAEAKVHIVSDFLLVGL